MPTAPSASTPPTSSAAESDVVAVSHIGAIATILEVVCAVTGLGFSAVARVTGTRWIACAVRDQISFGLLPGGELELQSTLCHEIRQTRDPIAIDHASQDAVYRGHPAPLRYGFQSYISMPILLASGEFFGTLCALDPGPAKVNTPATLGMFKLFAELIALHLDADHRLEADRAARDIAAERFDQLRSVIESAKDYAVISVNLEGTIVGWSRGAVDTFGWTQAQAIGQPFNLIWTDEDQSAGSPGRELKLARETGVAPDSRWHVRAGGRRIFVVGATRPVCNASGALTGFVKVCRDETDRTAAEKELADARRRSESALFAGEVGTFHWDIASDRVYGDANFARLFGIRLDANGTLPIADYFAVIHPDDRAAAAAKIEHTLRTGEPFLAEYRIVAPGRTRNVVARGRVERDESGRPVAFPGVIVDVTDRKRAEAALGASEQRYRRLFEAIDEGFCTIQVLFEDDGAGNLRPADYHYEEVNPAFERQTGLRLQDVVGKRASEVLPDHEPYWFEIYGKVALTGEPVRFEHQAESMHRWYDVYATRVGDPADRRVAVVFSDISGRRQAEAALARQGRFLDAALSSVSDYTYSFDRDGRFKFVSQALLDLWGLRAEQAVGKNFIELAYPPELAEKLARQVEQVFQTRQTVSDVTDYTSPTGVAASYEYTFTPVLAPDGSVEAVAGVSRDTTERRRLERDREEMLAAERAARADAEQAGRMKDDFLTTLSHELRTPLNAIVGWTQILRGSTADPQDLAEGLAVIDRNARAQTQIIEDILDMSRIISGKLRLDVQSVDLAAIVRAGVDTVQPAADAKGVRLQMLLDPAAGPVTGDPNRLHQVFWNLLSNAVKFTPRCGRVQVVLERINSHLEVRVTDTGEGIAARFLPHVFDRFRQADASTTRRHGGLGLGLAIVKQLVELHGGCVSVASPGKGQGATFCVALPLTVAHATIVEPPAQREHPQSETPLDSRRSACDSLGGVTVLVVDDELDARTVVKRLLEECGAVVRTAGSATEALALLQEQTPDVLVSDIGMPGEDGYTLLRRVRALPPERGGRVHAAALTAYARAADRVRALEAGFQMHLSKPVEPVELVATVATLAKLAGAILPSAGT